jgi:hypothetical protein
MIREVKFKIYMFLIDSVLCYKTHRDLEVWLHQSWPQRRMQASDKIHTKADLFLGKAPRYPVDMRRFWSPDRTADCGG